jgi:uncharacterized protein (DUF433 family)
MINPITSTSIDIPLRQESDGTIRVGKTRVTLDVVIEAYLNGSSADQIAQDIDVLEASDVHVVVGYYLAHKAEIDAYLKQREEEATEIRRKWEKLHPSKPLSKATLKARLTQRKQGS